MEHIATAISFPYTSMSQLKQFPFPKDKLIVTYCGCPHHLSGLSAMLLIQNGYQHIRVLDEGFNVWKQQGYPVVKGPTPINSLTTRMVSGQLLDSKHQPISQQDIFLTHLKTGQIEATRTDEQGRFTITLHFWNVSETDQMLFSLMNNQNVTIKTLQDLGTPVQLTLQAPQIAQTL